MRRETARIWKLAPVLLAAAFPAAGGEKGPAPTGRVVVFVHSDDRLRSDQVVEALVACGTIPATAIVSYFDALNLVQDFTADAGRLRGASAKGSVGEGETAAVSSGGFSLAGRLPVPTAKSARSVLGALGDVANAVAPIGRGTTVVLLSRGVSMGERRGVGEQSVTRPIEHDTALLYGEGPGGGRTFDAEHMDRAFVEARDALARSGVRLVAVNVGPRYSPGLKALTEATAGGRYLPVGKEASAQLALGSSLCR